MDGSLGNLYKSIEDLEDVYFMIPRHKQKLLKPKFPNRGPEVPKVADDPSVKCPWCDSIMDRRVDLVEVPAGESGYAKELVKYLVMDELVVKPMTTDSCIAMLKDRDATIVPKFVDFGVDEGELLLEALLLSKTVLTDAFLGKKCRCYNQSLVLQTLSCLEQCSIN
ncbi:hypothetical protein NL676_003934 [Syzygium grande]|nr:hypothetical protein NL676_003934 [Syzygium grande]